MRTNKQATFNALNSHFLNTETMKINEGYLNDSLALALDNERALYDAMRDTRRRAHAVAWMALENVASSCISYEAAPNETTYASSEQLKAWLKQYGHAYDTIAETVQYIIDEREGKHE